MKQYWFKVQKCDFFLVGILELSLSFGGKFSSNVSTYDVFSFLGGGVVTCWETPPNSSPETRGKVGPGKPVINGVII